MPRRKRDRRLARWGASALLALALHALLGVALSLGGALSLFGTQKPRPPKVSPVVLRSLPKSTWADNRKVRSGLPQDQKLAPELQKERPPSTAGRVVDVAPGNGQKPNEEAKFLAESNNRVEKETVSRDRTLDYRAARPQPTAIAPPNQKTSRDATKSDAIAGNDGMGSDDSPTREGKKKAVPEIPGAERRELLALRLDGLDGRYRFWNPSGPLGNSARRSSAGDDDPEDVRGSLGRRGVPGLISLTPSSAVLDRIAGAPASDLSSRDGVAQGEATFLNTREWKYASFFNRVKQDVGSQWHPSDVIHKEDLNGQGRTNTDRLTVLSVTLDGQGQIEGLRILQSSGLAALDREAMAAFERAQPFRGPPPGLQNEHGEIAFSFGFHIEPDRAGLQWFRPQR